jgi:hypothetical protein
VEQQSGSIPPDEAGLIVELFVHRQEMYGEADVLRLARITPERLQEAIHYDEAEPVACDGVRCFAWNDVANLAFLRWTPRMVTEALRAANATHALPLLNQTRTIRLELPIYQIQLLHRHAVHRSEPGKPPLNASDIAADALRDLAEFPDKAAAQDIPGLIAARTFPAVHPLQPIAEASCLYCGSTSVGGGRAVCAECEARHEPPDEKKERL